MEIDRGNEAKIYCLDKGNAASGPGHKQHLWVNGQGWEGSGAGEALEQDGTETLVEPLQQGWPSTYQQSCRPEAQCTQGGVPSVVSTHLQPLLSHIHLGSSPARQTTGRRGDPRQGLSASGRGVWWEAQRQGIVRPGAEVGHLGHSAAAAWTKRGMRGPSTPWRHSTWRHRWH